MTDDGETSAYIQKFNSNFDILTINYVIISRMTNYDYLECNPNNKCVKKQIENETEGPYEILYSGGQVC